MESPNREALRWKVVAIAALLVAATSFLVPPARGQATGAPQEGGTTPGRFEIQAVESSLYLLDTATGQCWMKPASDGSPKDWYSILRPILVDTRLEKGK